MSEKLLTEVEVERIVLGVIDEHNYKSVDQVVHHMNALHRGKFDAGNVSQLAEDYLAYLSED